ncbi:unnamed protein product, partial [Symbiodinium sp. CCMP2456]
GCRGLGEDVEEPEDREVDVESELSAWEASIAKRIESLDALESMLENLPCAVKGGVRMTTTSGPAIMTQESVPQQNSRHYRLVCSPARFGFRPTTPSEAPAPMAYIPALVSHAYPRSCAAPAGQQSAQG